MARKQTIALIGAVSRDGVYGFGRGDKGCIPWKVKADMDFFRRTTTGEGDNVIVMSRGMWSALPEKYRPLQKRKNIIVTSNKGALEGVPDDVFVAASVGQALERAKSLTFEQGDIFFAGGYDMWYNTAHLANTLFINVIHVTPIPGASEDVVTFDTLLHPQETWPHFVGHEVEQRDDCGVVIDYHKYFVE